MGGGAQLERQNAVAHIGKSQGSPVRDIILSGEHRQGAPARCGLVCGETQNLRGQQGLARRDLQLVDDDRSQRIDHKAGAGQQLAAAADQTQMEGAAAGVTLSGQPFGQGRRKGTLVFELAHQADAVAVWGNANAFKRVGAHSLPPVREQGRPEKENPSHRYQAGASSPGAGLVASR